MCRCAYDTTRAAAHLCAHTQFVKVALALDLPPDLISQLATLAQIQHGGGGDVSEAPAIAENSPH
jgi:hypothetical protein